MGYPVATAHALHLTVILILVRHVCKCVLHPKSLFKAFCNFHTSWQLLDDTYCRFQSVKSQMMGTQAETFLGRGTNPNNGPCFERHVILPKMTPWVVCSRSQ